MYGEVAWEGPLSFGLAIASGDSARILGVKFHASLRDAKQGDGHDPRGSRPRCTPQVDLTVQR